MNNWIKNILRVKGKRLLRISLLLMVTMTTNVIFASGSNDSSSSSVTDSLSISAKSDNLIRRNLFVELFGSSLGIGIGYDQRFVPNSVFGFSAGLAFTSGSVDNGGWWGANDGTYTDVDFKGVTIPLEVNAIMGNRASKFELGIGATPCILNRNEKSYKVWEPEIDKFKSGTKLNIVGTLNIGYRLQRKSGFFLRAGISFLVGDIKCSPIDGLICLPNLSLGYTIQ